MRGICRVPDADADNDDDDEDDVMDWFEETDPWWKQGTGGDLSPWN